MFEKMEEMSQNLKKEIMKEMQEHLGKHDKRIESLEEKSEVLKNELQQKLEDTSQEITEKLKSQGKEWEGKDEKRQEVLKQEIDEKLARVQRTSCNTDSKIKLDKVIPEFKNNYTHIPVEYIEALESVLNKFNANEDMEYILNKSLKGIAHDWRVLIKHPGITLEELKKKFINEF
jgi:hypothetical protein